MFSKVLVEPDFLCKCLGRWFEYLNLQIDLDTLKTITISKILMACVAHSAGKKHLATQTSQVKPRQALCKDGKGTSVFSWGVWIVPQLEKDTGKLLFCKDGMKNTEVE